MGAKNPAELCCGYVMVMKLRGRYEKRRRAAAEQGASAAATLLGEARDEAAAARKAADEAQVRGQLTNPPGHLWRPP